MHYWLQIRLGELYSCRSYQVRPERVLYFMKHVMLTYCFHDPTYTSLHSFSCLYPPPGLLFYPICQVVYKTTGLTERLTEKLGHRNIFMCGCCTLLKKPKNSPVVSSVFVHRTNPAMVMAGNIFQAQCAHSPQELEEPEVRAGGCMSCSGKNENTM